MGGLKFGWLVWFELFFFGYVDLDDVVFVDGEGYVVVFEIG